ncbi:Beta-enolase [Saguinus oedipus]|uniref:phosphopyruvate hydratase n=1 Tax=Saguinus oedipus TaxID=9490 RepID=A0ABQ9U5F2_SAGOE|nr:Beta-enolase [Saguinus oedipus]
MVIYEALELRVGDKACYLGKGVLKAVERIKTLGPALLEKKLSVDQEKVDKFMIELDRTENKSKFGASIILGMSFTKCKMGTTEKGVLPYCHIVDLTGNPDLITPSVSLQCDQWGFPCWKQAGHMGVHDSACLPPPQGVIEAEYGKDATSVGDEGDFTPNILENSEALELLKMAIHAAGYPEKVVIGMDVAASENGNRNGKYDLNFKSADDPTWHIAEEKLRELCKSFIKNCPVVSIEDPFDQDGWASCTSFLSGVGIQIVRDDLTVTNPKRIAQAIEKKACNSLLLKVNQISLMTESIQAYKLTQSNGWGVM